MKKSDMTLEQMNEAFDKLAQDQKVSIFRKLLTAFILDILNWFDKAEERRIFKAMMDMRRR